MRKAFAFSLLCVAIAGQPAQSAMAACPADLSSLVGGQVYFDDGGTSKPFVLASVPPTESRTMNLFYVVRAAQNRSGVIIIKLASVGANRTDRVRLVRSEPV